MHKDGEGRTGDTNADADHEGDIPITRPVDDPAKDDGGNNSGGSEAKFIKPPAIPAYSRVISMGTAQIVPTISSRQKKEAPR